MIFIRNPMTKHIQLRLHIFFIYLSCSGGNLGFPIRIYYWLLSISTKFAIKWFSGFRKEDENEKSSQSWQQTKSYYRTIKFSHDNRPKVITCTIRFSKVHSHDNRPKVITCTIRFSKVHSHDNRSKVITCTIRFSILSYYWRKTVSITT